MFEDKAAQYNEEEYWNNEKVIDELIEKYGYIPYEKFGFEDIEYMDELWKVHEDYQNNEFEYTFLKPTEEWLKKGIEY